MTPNLDHTGVFETDVQRSGSSVGTDEHVLLVTTCWWAATAHFAHLLVQAGCRVSALSPQGHAVQAVDGVTLYRQRPYLPIRRIAEVIRHSKPNLIVPADDRAVAYLHRLHKSGTSSERALIERSIGSPEHYDTVLSRVRLLALAQRLGIAVPANTAVASVDEMSRVLQRDRGPWVVKTDGAWSGHGVRIVTSRERAVNAAHGLRRRQQLAPALLRLLIYRDPYWLAASMRRERPELSVQGFVEGWPATLAMLTTRPYPAAIMPGSTAEQVSIGPTRFTSTTRRHCSTGRLSIPPASCSR